MDGHSLWANSKALEIAGVNRDTPDPILGFSYYARDASGYILEGNPGARCGQCRGTDRARHHGPADGGLAAEGVGRGYHVAVRAGVPLIDDDQGALLRLYTDVAPRGALPLRRQAGFGRRVAFAQDQWQQLIGQLDATGYDLHVHACAERTARWHWTRSRRPPRRTRLATAATPSPMWCTSRTATIPGSAGLASSPSSPLTGCRLIRTLSRTWPLGTEPRKDLLYRPHAVLKFGGRISLGTDWPAAGYFSTYKPLDSIQIGVTRQLIGQHA